MKKYYLLLFSVFVCVVGGGGCTASDLRYYVSTSGSGALVVGNDSSSSLDRMTFFNSLQKQELYLMGDSAYTNSAGEFCGSGPVVIIETPSDSLYIDKLLQAQTFSIDNDTYCVSYTNYTNYLYSQSADNLVVLESGTVIIRTSSDYYDVRVLGVDSADNNVLISFSGYIYRWFYEIEN